MLGTFWMAVVSETHPHDEMGQHSDEDSKVGIKPDKHRESENN